MECRRCRGLMVVDRCWDLQESMEISFSGWRCLICGEIIDPIIMQNRLHRPLPPKRSRARKFLALA